jgi:hypothetical protein
MRRLAWGGPAAAAILIWQASTALACGALVAPNGSVRLGQATTLVAWHDGIEHYLTSFTYAGADAAAFGYIIPLPAAPISPVVEGGRWTLQRLEREVAPPVEFAGEALSVPEAAPATVLQQVRVAALDITVIRGTGGAIVTWCYQNGFTLPAETRDHLLRYARVTPYFLAAKYNLARAQRQQLLSGDGTPVLITMRTPSLWVPLEILAEDGQPVNADLFLLTDSPLSTGEENALLPTPGPEQMPGAPGFELVRSEPMNASLFHDLSTDRNMGWVWRESTLTYLTLRAPGSSVDYDLGVSPGGNLRLASFATPPAGVAMGSPRFAPNPWTPWLPLASILAVVALVVAAGTVTVLHRRSGGARTAPV